VYKIRTISAGLTAGQVLNTVVYCQQNRWKCVVWWL